MQQHPSEVLEVGGAIAGIARALNLLGSVRSVDLRVRVAAACYFSTRRCCAARVSAIQRECATGAVLPNSGRTMIDLKPGPMLFDGKPISQENTQW